MDPIFAALALGGALAAGFLYDRWRVRHWQGIAADCGLNVVRVSGLAWRLTLRAQAGSLKVRFTSSRHNKGGTQVAIVIPGPPGFSEVSIRREYQAPWKTHEIEIGSKSFDQTFYVEGPKRLVPALFDAEARRLLTNANDVLTTVGSRLEITGGELLAETVDRQLSLVLPFLLKVGERFAQPVDVEQRLIQNATQDPEAGVRLRAALALGAQGRGFLLELAENLADDAVSARAVSSLGRELTFESTKDILLDALRRRRLQTAQACLEALGRNGDASAAGVLVEVVKREQGDLAVSAARALETTGGPSAERPLIQALQRDHKDLRVAAANALGRMGSPAAVLPLKEAAERFPDPDLGWAVNQAIAEIQSRLPGASPGQLSLAGAEVGQLSLAQADAGQLSLATDPAGQISLSGADTPGAAPESAPSPGAGGKTS